MKEGIYPNSKRGWKFHQSVALCQRTPLARSKDHSDVRIAARAVAVEY